MARHWYQIAAGPWPGITTALVFDGQAPPNSEVGYIIEVRRKGHDNCQCMRHNESWLYFRPHDHCTGTWPAHAIVMDFYAWEFFQAHPEFEVKTPSYGYMRRREGARMREERLRLWNDLRE
jgi:hypothetical protein